jgi:predicted DNA-binding transcriptional regulator AlpA
MITRRELDDLIALIGRDMSEIKRSQVILCENQRLILEEIRALKPRPSAGENAPSSAEPAPMLFLRLKDLKDLQICTSWPQLKRLVDNCGFPPGRYLSKNLRAWTAVEVTAWVESRPSAGKAA